MGREKSPQDSAGFWKWGGAESRREWGFEKGHGKSGKAEQNDTTQNPENHSQKNADSATVPGTGNFPYWRGS